MVILRPRVSFDEHVWEQILLTIQKSNNRPSFFMHESKERTIVETDEHELCTKDKVFLLISRILSDKKSLVAKVYRGLIQVFDDRLNQRDLNECRLNLQRAYKNYSQGIEDDNNYAIEDNRARRLDAHAIIHYTSLALFDARPNLKKSPKVCELSIMIVEDLVLGRLYHSVMEEIRFETYEKDNFLSSQIHSLPLKDRPNIISTEALQCIQSLPEPRSAVAKLNHCVQFIELISLSYTIHKQDPMCTDSLITLVCQHIIYAQIPCINAEIAFIEEFVRDEQLLNGKEGYVLVTLQASLFYLNSTTCVYNQFL